MSMAYTVKKPIQKVDLGDNKVALFVPVHKGSDEFRPFNTPVSYYVHWDLPNASFGSTELPAGTYKIMGSVDAAKPELADLIKQVSLCAKYDYVILEQTLA